MHFGAMPNLKHKNPRTLGANDNSPAWIMSAPKRVAGRNRYSKTTKINVRTPKLSWVFPLIASLIIVLLPFLGLAAENFIKIAGFVGLAGFFWASYCKRIHDFKSRELSLLISLISCVLALFGTAIMAGIELNTIDIALFTALTALIIGFCFKSAPALLASTLSLLTWLFAAIPEANAFFGLGQTYSAGWTNVVPILLIAQLYLATRLKSVSCLLLITVLGYAWGIWLGLSFNMPLTAVAGLIFAVGIAQHRLGKSMIDSKTFGASTHSWVGILSALMAAHYLQVSWLSPEMNSEIPAWIPTQIWWGAFLGAALVLFVSSLIRFKHSYITLPGIFILSLSAAVLPLASIKPGLIRDVFFSIPGLLPAPGFGLVIGAVIMAAGMAWIVNGLRKSQFINIIVGTVLIGTQVLILMAPGRIDLDGVIIFLTSLIGALCIGAMIAGASLDHSQPAARKS